MLKIVLAFVICATLNAHSLKVFAAQDGDFVGIKTYFYGNSPCKECKVEFIKDGKIFETLKTDDKGELKAKLKENKFEILVDGGLAHEKKITFETNSPIAADESSESNQAYITKFAIAFGAIFGIFALLYLLKRRK
ncbi:Co/Ni ABC transporter CbiKLMQO, membrane protein CbiL [Campylobacter iguaniorum]|uniref:hypothetical protein n=1 Tax=Campylobacter iguaniorum TaxID=1244531 RepID=UPI00073A0D3C|nr:hypothetical protein [Campylobacter iguaniorum]ALV23796.1 Co/Ni ABC transporter CbiKLMQO, membrane protein CbiL [Campylobacter iguaniorum]